MAERSWRADRARASIVEAAWRLVDELGPGALLAGVALGDIARAAGMSRAGLGHHFATRDELGTAMAEWLVEQTSMLPVDEVERLLEVIPAGGVLETVRATAQANWDLLTTADEIRFQGRLLRVVAAALDERPETVELRCLIRERFWGRYLPALATSYELALARSGLRLIEPLVLDEVARILDGMAEALVTQFALDAGAIRGDLYADAVSVILTAITVPVAETVSVDDLASFFVPRESAVPRVDLDGWLEFLELVVALFGDGIDGVTFTALAHAGRRNPTEVRETFATVRTVAASAFVRHLARLEEAARRNAGATDRALPDVLCEIARAAAAEPHIAQALLAERLLARTTWGTDLGPSDIRMLVPLDAMVTGVMRHTVGVEVRSLVELATSVVNTLLASASTHPSEPPHVAVAHALRLVPSPSPPSAFDTGKNAGT